MHVSLNYVMFVGIMLSMNDVWLVVSCVLFCMCHIAAVVVCVFFSLIIYLQIIIIIIIVSYRIVDWLVC